MSADADVLARTAAAVEEVTARGTSALHKIAELVAATEHDLVACARLLHEIGTDTTHPRSLEARALAKVMTIKYRYVQDALK